MTQPLCVLRSLSASYRRYVAWSALVILAFGPGATSAHGAQAPPQIYAGSVLSLLDSEGRRIGVGEEFSGRLGIGTLTLPQGQPVQAWSLEGSFADRVTIDLRSDDFDSYLYLLGPGLAELLSDDDGAGGCDARLTLALPANGPFLLVVSTLGASEGTFTLAVTREPGETTAGACGGISDADFMEAAQNIEDQGVLQVPQTVSGLLDPDDPTLTGGPAQAWTVTGAPGEPLTVDLVSTAFDAFLYILADDAEPLSDDDSGGACHARLSTRFGPQGRVRVLATSIGGAGPFTLTVADRDGPTEPGACGGDGGGLFPDDPSFEHLETMGRVLQRGADRNGQLTADDATWLEGQFAQAWELELESGEPVVIELLSTEFDVLLFVEGPGDFSTNDDDTAGECNARVRFEPPEGGSYRVIATSIAPGVTGAFRLRVGDEAGPPARGACG